MHGAWIRRLAIGGSVALLGACAKPTPPLYSWEGFPRQQYEALLRGGSGAPAEQLPAMEAHAEKARATGAALPPGFRAHLGLLKLSSGDPAGAAQAWEAEKLAFPESAPYMDHLLKRLTAPAGKTESPA